MNKHTSIPEATLAQARKTVATDTVQLAAQLFEEANPGASWRDAEQPTLRNWILTAASHQRDAQLVLDIEQAILDEAAQQRTKGDAVDAYRATITSRIPAHRIETRINGFKDGWEAAMLALRGEDTK